MIVGFDLDEVICNLRGLLSKTLQQRTGRAIDPTQWVDYSIHKAYGILHEDMLDIIVEDKILERASLEPFAADAVRRIRDIGHETAIITARAFHPEGESITRDWLASHDIDVDRLILTGESESKADAMKPIGHFGFYVDDNLRHLEDVSRVLPEVGLFVIDRPWNRGDNIFRRIGGIEEYAHAVQEASCATRGLVL